MRQNCGNEQRVTHVIAKTTVRDDGGGDLMVMMVLMIVMLMLADAVQMIYPPVRPCFNAIWRCPDRLLWICKLGFDRLFAVIANILADTEVKVVIRRFVNSLSHSKSDSKTLGKLN